MKRLLFALAALLAAPAAVWASGPRDTAMHEGCEAYRVGDGGIIERHVDQQIFYFSPGGRQFQITEDTYARILDYTSASVPVPPQTPFIPTLPTLPTSTVDVSFPDTTGYTVWTVRASGGTYNLTQLQNALNDATTNCGSAGLIIDIEAGQTITIPSGTPFKLKVTDCAGKWVIIRSSAFASLPALGTRVQDSDAANMPTIRTTTTNANVFNGSKSMLRYRLVGLHIKNDSTATFNTVALIHLLGGESAVTTLGQIPRQIILDRSILEGNDTGETGFGTFWQCGDCAIVDSRIQNIYSRISGSATETKAIGISGTADGPILVQNNFLEAAGIILMVGGDKPVLTNVEAHDVTIRKNYFFRRSAWSTSTFSKKNTFEFKYCDRCLVEANYFEGNWMASNGQQAQCMNLKTSASLDGAPWVKTHDITVRFNACLNHEGYFIDLGTGPVGGTSGEYMNRIYIHDNLGDGISNGNQVTGVFGFMGGGLCTGSSCPAAVDQISRNIFLNHNTMVASTRSNASMRGGWHADLDVDSSNSRCTDRYATHNNVFPLQREGATGTDNQANRCRFNGTRNDALAWSNDYDSWHANLPTNSTAAGCTTPSLATKYWATYPVGCSSDQASQFTTFSVSCIGAGCNDYTLAGGSPGKGAASDAAARTAEGLSTDVGVDFGKLTENLCGVLIGNYTSCTAAPAPTVTSSTPNTGSYLGGTSVTNLAGTNFVGGATVTYGGSAATDVVVVSPTQITLTTPAHAAGVVDIIVTNADMQSGTCSGCFTYTGSGDPTISTVVPASGTAFGGVSITITGTNFAAGATVLIGTQSCGSVVVVTDTQITCTPPLRSVPAAVNVTVQNPTGNPVTLVNGYTYTKPVLAVPN